MLCKLLDNNRTNICTIGYSTPEVRTPQICFSTFAALLMNYDWYCFAF